MNDLINKCHKLIIAYQNGDLGQTKMPEDSHPATFKNNEEKLCYFTLPMALNYQRNSYKLWEAAFLTYQDHQTRILFNVKKSSEIPSDELRVLLSKYKLALQPNKHITTWQTICDTVSNKFGTISQMINQSDHDFLKLQKIIQKDYKKGFPYLSGPKIFNYWSYILWQYGGIDLINREYIEIAPDTHVIQCSVKLGIITSSEADILSRNEISRRWREALNGSKIDPIIMHSPLWFWSRNGFKYDLD